MILGNVHLLTTLEIWMPRYSDAYKATGERVALLADYKLQQASPVVLVEFTKAKHLLGQRFCIRRDEAMRYPLDTNGKIPCRAVPMSAFEHWDSVAEVMQTIEDIGW